MLFSRRAATQGAALQIRCLFICAEPDSLLSPPPLPCLTLKTPSQPERTFSKWKLSVFENVPCSSRKHSARWDVPVPSEGWRYAFQLGIRRGRGLCRAPSEQSQSSHVNFSRSRRASAMFRLWRWTEKYNNRNPAVEGGGREKEHTDLIALHLPVHSDQRGRVQRCAQMCLHQAVAYIKGALCSFTLNFSVYNINEVIIQIQIFFFYSWMKTKTVCLFCLIRHKKTANEGISLLINIKNKI